MLSQSPYYNFAKQVFNSNKHQPNKWAFVDDENQISYGELEQQSRSFASSMHHIGVRPGDRIMLAMTDSIDVPVAMLGCILGGYVFVPCNPRSSLATLEKCFNMCMPCVVLADTLIHEDLIEIAKKCHTKPRQIISTDDLANYCTAAPSYDPPTTLRDSVAYWFFTSGGSGEPKAVMHAHGTMEIQSQGLAEAYDISHDDMIYNTAKLFWSYGFVFNFLATLSQGATSILLEKLPTPNSVFSMIRRHRPTILISVPRIYVWLLESAENLQDLPLKFCISGGELLPESLVNEWEKITGIDLYDLYGATETGGASLANTKKQRKINTVGRPLAGYELEIRNGDGTISQPGEIGELFVKTSALGLGYHGDLEKTRLSFQGCWFRTNDKFVQDQDGYFRFVGRVNDMFRVNASWISPAEIENVLSENELVKEAGVVGGEDKHGLSQVCAFVVLKSGVATPANFEHELKTLVRRRLDPLKSPKIIKIVPQLPRNENGKIQRFLLKELL